MPVELFFVLQFTKRHTNREWDIDGVRDRVRQRQRQIETERQRKRGRQHFHR